MSIANKVNTDIKTFMKSGETQKRDILRLVASKAKLTAKEDMKRPAEDRTEASDADMLAAIQRQIKQNKETIDFCVKENRPYEKEQQEVDILMEYLPKQKTEDEIKVIVTDIINKIPVEERTAKARGLIMKELAPYKDELDMKLAGIIAGQILGL
jgi:uncharacterized protein YqeY